MIPLGLLLAVAPLAAGALATVHWYATIIYNHVYESDSVSRRRGALVEVLGVEAYTTGKKCSCKLYHSDENIVLEVWLFRDRQVCMSYYAFAALTDEVVGNKTL